MHVKSQSLDDKELLAALKAGHYYSSQGPLIHDIAIDGDHITIEPSPVDTIAVLCGISRTTQKIGRAITSATLDLSKLKDGWLMEKTSPWIRIAVIDNAGKRAWSNPYWLDGVV